MESTALHTSKDLAVSLPCRHGIRLTKLSLPETPWAFAVGVTARTSWITPDGGYPLPFPLPRRAWSGMCSDFPLDVHAHPVTTFARSLYNRFAT